MGNTIDLVADVEPLVIGLPLCLAKNSSLEYVILAGFGLSRKVRYSRQSPQYVILRAYFILLYGLLGIFYEFIEHPFRIFPKYTIANAYQCIKNHFHIIPKVHLVNISRFKFATGGENLLHVFIFISDIVAINEVI